jgi:hypothetical protein
VSGFGFISSQEEKEIKNKEKENVFKERKILMCHLWALLIYYIRGQLGFYIQIQKLC